MSGGPDIYLMRHGETVWNVQTRLQGRRDSPLTARGVAQAQAFGRRLKELHPDPAGCRVVASPLGRAWQTAVIAIDGMGGDAGAITLDDRIAEHSFGAWEGLTWAEVNRDHAESLAARMADRWNVPAPGGESYADVARRVTAWLEELSGMNDDRPLLVFSHGVSSRVIRGLYGRLPNKATMGLQEPQDRVFWLRSGGVVEIEA